MNRLFISYRSADGKKDAHRLAEDLGRLYGPEQVFLDKHDLTVGGAWRDALMAALSGGPLVLVVLTPQYLGATEGGLRRIEQADDPVRLELLAARQGGATVLPLLADGVTMPRADALPEDLRFLPELHALPLRAEDWRNDLVRLVTQLERHGLAPRSAGWHESLGVAAPVRKRFWLGVATLLVPLLMTIIEAGVQESPDDGDTQQSALFLGGLVAWLAWVAWRRLRKAAHWGRHVAAAVFALVLLLSAAHLVLAIKLHDGSGVVAPQAASGSAATVPEVAGTWAMNLAPRGPLGPITLTQDGAEVRLLSPRIDMSDNDNVKILNDLARQRGGMVVESGRMKGLALLQGRTLNGLLNLVVGQEEVALTAGTMKLELQPDGRTLQGTLDLMDGSGPKPFTLTRSP